MVKSKKKTYMLYLFFTATLWLLITTIFGLLLIYNFTYNILSKDSLAYLPLHAHLGIIGWFLFVGNRRWFPLNSVIPYFKIS